ILDYTDEIKAANFEIQISPQLPILFGNRTRIFQIFENLLLNALRYGRGQQNMIKVESTLTESVVKIYVSDHGPGIPREYWEKIFGLFTRLVSDTKGTGVGLAIVKRSIQALGGEVKIEPTRTGTRFAIELPISCLHQD